MHLHTRPITKRQADIFINTYHRHHGYAHLAIFNVGAFIDNKLVGVAQCGRPSARHLCDGYTIEVKRLCTTGEPNVCSYLYSKCARIARELGYRHIVTYIYDIEPGTSLVAAGWQKEADTPAKSWHRENRPRPTCISLPLVPKQRYGRHL